MPDFTTDDESEDDIDDLNLSLSDGLTIALRYRRSSGRFRTEILSAERRWPMLADIDDEEDEG